MKILKRGSKVNKLTGSCQDCGCKVRVTTDETKELIDRDTQHGMATRYVKCPECGRDYLWVK